MGIVRLVAGILSAALVGAALYLGVAVPAGAHLPRLHAAGAADLDARLVRFLGFGLWLAVWFIAERARRLRPQRASVVASRHLSYGPVAVYAVMLLVAIPLEALAVERSRAALRDYIRNGAVADGFEPYYPASQVYARDSPAAALYYRAVREGLESGDPAIRTRAVSAYFVLRDDEIHVWSEEGEPVSSLVSRAFYDHDPVVRETVRSAYAARRWPDPIEEKR
jgi:hypothetical protein